MSKIAFFCAVCLGFLGMFSTSYASLTKEQSDEVAEFATTFIEEGNKRRDENGYPLLVYALSNNWKTCIEIRRSGYYSELYHVSNNNYHKKNGAYLDLGDKWTMDCGDFISYVYHTTLGLDLVNHENDDPWHIKDMYADANKYEKSQYFEFVYKNVPISSINESKLEKGDVVLYFGPKDNHGLIYVGEGMLTAHASRNGIKYSKNPPILGFEVVTLNRFYKTSTIVSIVRVKDGVVPETQKVCGTIIWPDNYEEGILLERERNSRELEEILNEKILAEIASSGENIVLTETPNPLNYEEVEANLENKEIVYIEKEMINWITDGLKKFYQESDENQEEKL